MKTYYLFFFLLFLCTSCSKYHQLDKSYSDYSTQINTVKSEKSSYPESALEFIPPDFQLAHFHKKLRTGSLNEVFYKKKKDGSFSFKYGKEVNLKIKELKEKNKVFIADAYPHLVFFYSKNANLLDVRMTTTYTKAEQYLLNEEMIANKDSVILSNKAQQLKDSLFLSYMETQGDSLAIVNAQFTERQVWLKEMEQKLNDDISFLQLFIRKLQEKGNMLNTLSFQCALSMYVGNPESGDIFQETYQQLPNFPGHKAQKADNFPFGYNKLHPIAVQRIRQLRSYLLHPEKLSEEFKKKDFSIEEIERLYSWLEKDKDPIHILIGAQSPLHQINASKDKPLNNLDFFHLFGGAIQLNSATSLFSPYDEMDKLKEDLQDYHLFVKVAQKAGFCIYASNTQHPKFKENHLNLIPVEFQNEEHIRGTPIAMKVGSQWMKKLDHVLDLSIAAQEENIAEQEDQLLQGETAYTHLFESIAAKEVVVENTLTSIEQLAQENYSLTNTIRSKENVIAVQQKKVVLLESQNFDKQNKLFTDQINQLRRTIKKFLQE